jgi:hypothetical protein
LAAGADGRDRNVSDIVDDLMGEPVPSDFLAHGLTGLDLRLQDFGPA